MPKPSSGHAGRDGLLGRLGAGNGVVNDFPAVTVERECD